MSINAAGMGMTEKQRREAREVGRRLQLMERAIKKSSKDIADGVGVSTSAWSDYLWGNRRLPHHIAGLLRSQYGVGLEWLYLNEEHTNSQDFQKQLEEARKTPPPVKRGRKPKPRDGASAPVKRTKQPSPT